MTSMVSKASCIQLWATWNISMSVFLEPLEEVTLWCKFNKLLRLLIFCSWFVSYRKDISDYLNCQTQCRIFWKIIASIKAEFVHRSWPKLKGYFCKPLERIFLAYFHMQDKPRYWYLLENGVVKIIILTVHENSSWEHLSAHCSAQKCWFKGPECGCYVLTWTSGSKE